MAAAVSGFVDAHSGGAVFSAHGACVNSDVGQAVGAEIRFEKQAILWLRLDCDDFSCGAGEFAEQARKVPNIGADIEKVAAWRI